MQIRIKFLAVRLQLFNAVAFQRFEKITLDQFNAFDQCLEGAIGGCKRIGWDALDAATGIVRYAQHIACKGCNGIGARVSNFFLGPAAEIFHIRHRAQRLILQARIFHIQRLNDGKNVSFRFFIGSRCCGFGISRRLIGHGTQSVKGKRAISLPDIRCLMRKIKVLSRQSQK